MTTNNGGPAFPVITPIAHDGGVDAALIEEGMSLRDYLAAHADISAVDVDDVADLAVALGITIDGVSPIERIRRGAAVGAAMRYIFADAMLEARKK